MLSKIIGVDPLTEVVLGITGMLVLLTGDGNGRKPWIMLSCIVGVLEEGGKHALQCVLDSGHQFGNKMTCTRLHWRREHMWIVWTVQLCPLGLSWSDLWSTCCKTLRHVHHTCLSASEDSLPCSLGSLWHNHMKVFSPFVTVSQSTWLDLSEKGSPHHACLWCQTLAHRHYPGCHQIPNLSMLTHDVPVQLGAVWFQLLFVGSGSAVLHEHRQRKELFLLDSIIVSVLLHLLMFHCPLMDPTPAWTRGCTPVQLGIQAIIESACSSCNKQATAFCQRHTGRIVVRFLHNCISYCTASFPSSIQAFETSIPCFISVQVQLWEQEWGWGCTTQDPKLVFKFMTPKSCRNAWKLSPYSPSGG